MYKLIAFDIDGTILPQGQKALSKEVLKMFEDLKKAGYMVAFVTGREFITIDKMIDTPNVDYFLGANGTFIYDMKSKEILWERIVEYDDYKELEEYCIENNLNLSVITQEAVYFKEKGSYEGNWFWEQFYDLIKPINDPSLKQEKIHQITIRTNDEDMKVKTVDFVNGLEKLEVNTVWCQGMFVGSKGINKAFGISKLGEMLNFDLSEVIAFGDGQNDIQMIEEVGMGIAMGNACKELKAVSKDSCESVENFGTMKKLKELNIL